MFYYALQNTISKVAAGNKTRILSWLELEKYRKSKETVFILQVLSCLLLRKLLNTDCSMWCWAVSGAGIKRQDPIHTQDVPSIAK